MTKFFLLLLLSLLPIHADLVAHYALDETDPATTTVTDSLGLNNSSPSTTPSLDSFTQQTYSLPPGIPTSFYRLKVTLR